MYINTFVVTTENSYLSFVSKPQHMFAQKYWGVMRKHLEAPIGGTRSNIHPEQQWHWHAGREIGQFCSLNKLPNGWSVYVDENEAR